MTRPDGEGRDRDSRTGGRPQSGDGDQRRGFRRSASTGDSGTSRASDRSQGDQRRTPGYRTDDTRGANSRGGPQSGAGDQRRGFRRSAEAAGDSGAARSSGSRGTDGGDQRRAGFGKGERSAGDRNSGSNRSDRGPRDGDGRSPGRDRTGSAGGRSVSGNRGGDAAGGREGRGPKQGDQADRGESLGGDRAGGRSGSFDRERTAGRGGRGPKRTAADAKAGMSSAAARRAERAGADPVRVVARDVLRAVRERDAYANLVLPGLLRERHISGRDAALATELTYGASRSQGLLDAVIADCAGRDVEEIDGPLLDALRLGTYQLLRTRIGAHAAVDTSVALVRAEYGQGRAGFVNAVLRRVAERTPEEWVERLAPRDSLGHLAFEYAHPVWIAQAFADALGARAGELADVLAADDARPAVHLVARPGDITAEELALVTGGEEGRWSPYAVYLEGGDPAKLEPVREGMAAVQDEGSQLVALAVTRAPLEGPDTGRWLDLCAGPGGKTALLAAIADIDGFRVDAVEPAEHRADLVRKATRGMPVDVHVADGRDSGLTPGFDRILVDAPCTGLGALRRRPEARWRRQPSDVRDLVTLQRELLTAAWDLVRPGGVVIYSTCSPHLPETVSVVADMVRRTGAEQLDTRELLPGVPELGDGPGAQLWPHRHGTDAMFLAALRKPLQPQ